MITEELIKTVAIGFKYLLEDIVFVGGAFVNLYSSDKSAGEIRPTDDIDCVIKVTHLSEYNKIEGKLRNLGFKNDLSKGAPICRYLFKGIKVDVMPTTGKLLGFNSRWYSDGFNNSVIHLFSDGLQIKILSPEYFLASKLEALWDRGLNDLRLSKDFEDIIFIIDSRPEIINEIKNSESALYDYITDKFRQLISNPDFEEGVSAVFPSRNRIGYIKSIFNRIINAD